jgi:hypothetical protein
MPTWIKLQNRAVLLLLLLLLVVVVADVLLTP